MSSDYDAFTSTTIHHIPARPCHGYWYGYPNPTLGTALDPQVTRIVPAFTSTTIHHIPARPCQSVLRQNPSYPDTAITTCHVGNSNPRPLARDTDALSVVANHYIETNRKK